MYEDQDEESEADKKHPPKRAWWAAGLYLPVPNMTKSRLILATTLVTVCAKFLVDSIDGMVKGSGMSETFVGLILLPIVGNAAEVQCPPRIC